MQIDGNNIHIQALQAFVIGDEVFSHCIHFYPPKIINVCYQKVFNLLLSQITIYGVACSICFANLNIHEQEEKPKNNGMKIIDSQGVIIQLDEMQPVLKWLRHGTSVEKVLLKK